ncbi:hypothetical protein Echvi_0291 [Echinicola vietnamensis DSM 17526]|uniref:Uncharacterized protein n=1 Tax=Echinicola vietnamensis (strain DSM 17526 / LMG 23754 / KMM 6221) TaxID=926556 RepID=L0FTG8_ECHVK|nr:hypothetical protein Echvi_0291 [Echinicola vietnamensis DSM 17526]
MTLIFYPRSSTISGIRALSTYNFPIFGLTIPKTFT